MVLKCSSKTQHANWLRTCVPVTDWTRRCCKRTCVRSSVCDNCSAFCNSNCIDWIVNLRMHSACILASDSEIEAPLWATMRLNSSSLPSRRCTKCAARAIPLGVGSIVSGNANFWYKWERKNIILVGWVGEGQSSAICDEPSEQWKTNFSTAGAY